jgi:hypothetical protein
MSAWKEKGEEEGQKAKSASTWQADNRRQDHVIFAFKSSLGPSPCTPAHSSLEFGVLQTHAGDHRLDILNNYVGHLI